MATIKNQPWVDRYLVPLGPCYNGRVFANRFETPELAWRACRHSEHLLFVLNKIGLDKWTRSLIACDMVDELLPIWERYFPDDQTPYDVLDVHREWATDNRGREPYWQPRLSWSEEICHRFSWTEPPEERREMCSLDSIVIRNVKWAIVFLLKKHDWDVVDSGLILRRCAKASAYQRMMEQAEKHGNIPWQSLRPVDEFLRDAYSHQCTLIRNHFPHPPIPNIPS